VTNSIILREITHYVSLTGELKRRKQPYERTGISQTIRWLDVAHERSENKRCGAEIEKQKQCLRFLLHFGKNQKSVTSKI
jgi:hypothetical protein